MSCSSVSGIYTQAGGLAFYASGPNTNYTFQNSIFRNNFGTVNIEWSSVIVISHYSASYIQNISMRKTNQEKKF